MSRSRRPCASTSDYPAVWSCTTRTSPGKRSGAGFDATPLALRRRSPGAAGHHRERRVPGPGVSGKGSAAEWPQKRPAAGPAARRWRRATEASDPRPCRHARLAAAGWGTLGTGCASIGQPFHARGVAATSAALAADGWGSRELQRGRLGSRCPSLGADGAAAMARRPRPQDGAAWCRSRVTWGRAARPVTPNVGGCPPGRGGRTFGAGGGGCGAAAGRAKRRRGRGVAASPTAKPAAARRPSTLSTGSGSREPRRPAGGGLGTDRRVSPVVPPAGAEVVPAGTADRRDALGGVSAVTVPDCGGQSVSPPPPGGRGTGVPLGLDRPVRCVDSGEVGCLTRVDVSPTVGVAEGAGAELQATLPSRRGRRGPPGTGSQPSTPLSMQVYCHGCVF